MRLLITVSAILCLVASLASGASLEKLLPRIVGGTEVNPAFKYPWIVALFSDGFFFCGGSLISPDYVLTAAHCSLVPPASLQVAVHRHDLRQPNTAENGIIRTISKVIVHPNYDADAILNDFAVWKLSTPITGVDLVALDTTGTISPTNTSSLIMGWGAIQYEGNGSPVLLETTIQISDFAACNLRYKGGLRSDIQICAGVPAGGKDTCQGDSGGPLLVQSAGNWVQVGVVSFGDGCALPDTPGVYSKVFGGRQFIADAQDDTKTDGCDSNPCREDESCIASINTHFCLNSPASVIIPSLLMALFSLAFSFFRF